MRDFIAEDGRHITPMPHVATFNGRHNANKTKTLIILNHFNKQSLTAKEIHYYSGVPLLYLRQRLTFWYRIRYVDRQLAERAGRPCWSYRIDERGTKFLNNRVPHDKLDLYIGEINAWVEKVRRNH